MCIRDRGNMGKYKKELLFTLAVLAVAAGLWLATHEMCIRDRS